MLLLRLAKNRISIERKSPLGGFLLELFCFLVGSVLFAVLAVLAQLQPVLQHLFIFGAEIVDPLAHRALQLYHVILGHI